LRAIREGLFEVFDDPATATARRTLLIAGVEVLPDSAYDRVLEMEQAARQAGYPELA
jgi:hypothetical protein